MSFDEPSQFLGGWGFNGSCCGETTLTAENCEFTNAYFGNGCGTIKALNFSDCVIGEGTRLNATREYASAQYVFTRTTIHGSFRDFASGFYDYYDCPAVMYDESCWNWVSVPFQFQEMTFDDCRPFRFQNFYWEADDQTTFGGNSEYGCGCRADFNGDENVNADDLGLLLSQWRLYVPPGNSADLDGDGIVRAGDLGLLMAAWGPCN